MPNPYNYHFDEATQTYHFITKNGIHYRVAFIVDQTFSAVSGLEIENIYQIIVDKVNDDLEKLDSQVAATIQVIVDLFFTNAQNAMIYICDEKDNKGEKRFNTFHRWYLNSTLVNYIIKMDNIIICNSNNKLHTIAIQLFF